MTDNTRLNMEEKIHFLLGDVIAHVDNGLLRFAYDSGDTGGAIKRMTQVRNLIDEAKQLRQELTDHWQRTDGPEINPMTELPQPAGTEAMTLLKALVHAIDARRSGPIDANVLRAQSNAQAWIDTQPTQ